MKTLIAATILLATLVLPRPVLAANDVWVSMMVRAYHSNREADFNENTLGVGVEWHPTDVGDVRWVAGAYHNSNRRASIYAGGVYMPLRFGNLRVGLMGGTISGYQKYDYRFGPMAAGVVSYETKRTGINLVIVPPIPGDKTPTWTYGLQLKMKVK